MSEPSNENDPTPEQLEEQQISAGVQMQRVAGLLGDALNMSGIRVELGLGAIAIVVAETIFRMHSDPEKRIPNRMAFDATVRNALNALILVEKEGPAAAARGLAALQQEHENQQANLNPAPPADPAPPMQFDSDITQDPPMYINMVGDTEEGVTTRLKQMLLVNGLRQYEDTVRADRAIHPDIPNKWVGVAGPIPKSAMPSKLVGLTPEGNA